MATRRNTFEPPERLADLLKYAARVRDWFCGYIEFGPTTPTKWFSEDAKANRQFLSFGMSGDGGDYCFWLYPGRSTREAPIVYLGGQAYWYGLVADNFDDFLSLLALGEQNLWDVVGFQRFQGPGERYLDNLTRFRNWLKRRYRITKPESPFELVERARIRHPDATKWVDDWCARRYGEPVKPQESKSASSSVKEQPKRSD